MPRDSSVLTIALKAGQRLMVHARGEPARILAVGTLAVLTAAGTAVVYGTLVHGRKLHDRLRPPG